MLHYDSEFSYAQNAKIVDRFIKQDKLKSSMTKVKNLSVEVRDFLIKTLEEDP